jgi:mediator of RNA polymerase II transcription subunit 5
VACTKYAIHHRLDDVLSGLKRVYFEPLKLDNIYNSNKMAPRSKNSNIEQWELFASRCLTTRLESQQFIKFSNLLSLRCPIRGLDTATIFLRPTSKDAEALDPRIPSYIDKLLEIGLVEFHDVLRALLLCSRFHRPHISDETEKEVETDSPTWRNPIELDEIILFRVSKAVNTGKCPRDFSEALGIIKAASNWMSDVANTSTADQLDQNMTGAPGSLTLEAINVREAVAMLVMTMADNAKITSILRGSCPRGRLLSSLDSRC